MARALAVLLAAAGAAACGGDHVRVIDRMEDAQSYTTVDVRLLTMEDLEAVTGEVVQIFGGASLDVLSTTPLEDRGANRDLFVSHPHPVRAHFVYSGGVAVPTDFDSLVMFTVYAHFESAALHFQELGVEAAGERVPVFVYPEIPGAEEVHFAVADNAAFMSALDFFIVLPMEVLRDIPFAMNRGVLTHEYAHRVWYYEAVGGDLVGFVTDLATAPDGTVNPAGMRSWNLLRATDEGVADFFGAAATGDPGFISYSVFPALAAPRDLSQERVLPAAWLAGDEPARDDVYDPYPLGSVLASTLWRLQESVPVAEVEAAVITAERSIGPRVRARRAYAVGELEAELLAALPSAHRPRGCDVFRSSYAVAWSRFSGVCP